MNTKLIFNGGAAAAGWIAVLFACIACGTIGWYKIQSGTSAHEIGLWKQCDTVSGVETCYDIVSRLNKNTQICGDHTEADLLKRIKAYRGFSIMSFTFGAVGSVFPVLALANVAVPVPAVVGIALSAVGGFFTLITFAVFIHTWDDWYSCGKSPCEGNTDKCTIPYSFALCVVACALFFISAGLQVATMIASADDVAPVKTEAKTEADDANVVCSS